MKLDLQKHGNVKTKLRKSFLNASPYPHIVIDNFLDEDSANKLLKEHADDEINKNWGSYVHFNEKKSGITKYDLMGSNTKKTIDSFSNNEFISWLEDLTNIKKLMPDPDLDGGGLHMIERGGFLNVHVDFLAHTVNKNWSRQLNLLLYLNKEWKEEWGGDLELWDENMKNCVVKIKPIFNRCVIFNTRQGSYHGHPDPLQCPPEVKRRSLALYYFRDEGKQVPLTPTNYQARPNENFLKVFLISLDRKLLWLFAFSKRYLGIKDTFIQKILKFFK